MPAVSRRGRLFAAAVAIVVFVLDQVTKRWAVTNLTSRCGGAEDSCVDLPGVTLRLVFNTGAAFAKGTGFGPVLGLLAIGICLFLVVMVWRTTDRLQAVLLGGVIGGAFGNVFDRLTRADEGLLSGAVIDFIDLGWWPVFNIADAAIVGGVAGLMAVALFADDAVQADDIIVEGQDPSSSMTSSSLDGETRA